MKPRKNRGFDSEKFSRIPSKFLPGSSCKLIFESLIRNLDGVTNTTRLRFSGGEMAKKRYGRQHNQYLTIKVRRIDDPKIWERKSHGKEHGLSFYETIAVLLEANEQAPLSRKMTDEAMTQFLAAEFPNSRGIKAILSRHRGRTLNHYRGLYNKGKLTGKKPSVPSHRWTMKGEVANNRTGRPLKEGERG